MVHSNKHFGYYLTYIVDSKEEGTVVSKRKQIFDICFADFKLGTFILCVSKQNVLHNQTPHSSTETM
jgi:hypothetical protein